MTTKHGQKLNIDAHHERKKNMLIAMFGSVIAEQIMNAQKAEAQASVNAMFDFYTADGNKAGADEARGNILAVIETLENILEVITLAMGEEPVKAQSQKVVPSPAEKTPAEARKRNIIDDVMAVFGTRAVARKNNKGPMSGGDPFVSPFLKDLGG